MDNNKIDSEKIPSAESVLKWLEEASQFVNKFLTKEELYTWEEVKRSS